MNKIKNITTAQTIILIGAIVYVLFPDLLIGPIDDTAVALIAGIAEVVLSCTKSGIKQTESTNFIE